MNFWALVFMIVTWTGVIALTVFCFKKMFGNNKKSA